MDTKFLLTSFFNERKNSKEVVIKKAELDAWIYTYFDFQISPAHFYFVSRLLLAFLTSPKKNIYLVNWKLVEKNLGVKKE